MAEAKTGKRGNPNWVKGGASPNPSGRSRLVDHLRDRALKACDETVIDAWHDECRLRPKLDHDGAPETHTEPETGKLAVRMVRGPDWVRCGQLLAEHGIGKPIQPVAVSGDGEGAPVSFLVRFDRGKK